MVLRQSADCRAMPNSDKQVNGEADQLSLLTTPEAAKRLGVSKRTLQQLLAERKIGFVKFGRNVRFSHADIQGFIDSHRSLPVGWKKGGLQ